ncbi:Hypothetical predicted protein [Paramuricea clavata]|uniref:Uncharacterized protein n=1 Tax=Paramuricea clavata TaxID=317549 RepID=A0A6S7GJD1_PARCT|nr:Hypothetical predicted protein [Paramuricea clavata]
MAANLGASNADSIKVPFDSVCASGCEDDKNSVKGPISLVNYNTKVVSTRADGASVNFGVYSGEAAKTLLHDWPALITAFNNTLATIAGCRPETRAKLKGFVKKLKNYPFLSQVVGYLDILNMLGLHCLVFEESKLVAFEIPCSVAQTLDTLEKISEEGVHNLSLSSHFAKFHVEQNDEGETNEHIDGIRVTYPNAGHEKRKVDNHEYLEVNLDEMESVGIDTVQRTLSRRKYHLVRITNYDQSH